MDTGCCFAMPGVEMTMLGRNDLNRNFGKPLYRISVSGFNSATMETFSVQEVSLWLKSHNLDILVASFEGNYRKKIDR